MEPSLTHVNQFHWANVDQSFFHMHGTVREINYQPQLMVPLDGLLSWWKDVTLGYLELRTTG